MQVTVYPGMQSAGDPLDTHGKLHFLNMSNKLTIYALTDVSIIPTDYGNTDYLFLW